VGVYSEIRSDGTERWIIQYFVNGRRRREVTPARTEKQAEYYLAKRKIAIEEGRWTDKKQIKRVRFEEYATEYLELKQLQGLKAFSRVELSLKYLTPFFGRLYLDNIQSNDILRYITKRRNTIRERPPHDHIAPATINRELACLRNLFREAMKAGIINQNPMFGIKLLKEDNVRNRCLSNNEEALMLKQSPPHMYGIILCALNTGMRKMEILTLTWDQVDLKNRFIFLRGSDTKTGYSRKIPITPTLHKYLSSLPRPVNVKYVFLYKGKPIREFTTSWNNIRKKTGIKDFKFHDLRHTFVTRMRKAGVHDHIIMSITGHKSRDMFKRYDTVDDEDLLSAAHNISALQNDLETKNSDSGENTGASSGARRENRQGRSRVNT